MTNQPTKKQPVKNIPCLYVSADLGAGNIKLYSKNKDGFPLSYPSVISYVNGADYYQGQDKILPPDLFYCCRSTNPRINGLNWFTGSSVLDRRLKANDPGRNALLKIENALPLLLSALIEKKLIEVDPATNIGEANLVVVASHHDATNLGEVVKNELEGAHEVVFNRKRYKLQIRMPQEAVVLEGEALTIPDAESFISMDLGYLTSLLLVHGKEGAITKQQPEKTGVNLLVSYLYENNELRKELGGVAPNREALVKAIQNPKGTEAKPQIVYRYENTSKDITTIYKDALKTWLIEALYSVRSLMEVEGSDTIVCLGGGTMLPYVRKALEQRGLRCYGDNPLYANVTSIYEKYLEPQLTVDPVSNHFYTVFEFPPFDKNFPKVTTAA